MRWTGFAFLAGAVVLAVHAYSPKSFDPNDAALTVYDEAPAESEKPDLGVRRPRVFAYDVATSSNDGSSDGGPVLKSLAERAQVRLGRGQESDSGVGKAAALPVAAVPPFAKVVEVQETVAPPADNVGKINMARAIKKELRRVGCFGGRIDADWDGAAKAATEKFLDRVNATLPNRPDHVLLMLVRNHKSMACGDVCPQGQALSDGRCMPNAIVAKMTRKAPVNVAEAAKPAASLRTVASSEVRPTASKVEASRLPGASSYHGKENATVVAGGVPTVSKGWWETFLTSSSPEASEAKEQTLDRPVGLTHVPQPRVVERSAAAPATAPAPAQQLTNLARTDTMFAPDAVEAERSDLAETRAVQQQTERARPRRAVRSARSYRARSYRPPPRYARRWSGRNVQSMFTHPLGRM